MEIRDLIYLTASATAGNFSRAAKSLGLNTSTISRRIGRLEDELGLALFERGRTGIRTTTGGEAVVLHVRRALAEIEAIRCAGSCNGCGEVGVVRMGVRMPPVGEPLRSLLAEWHEKNRNVVLTISEMNERDIVGALERRHLDVALMTKHTLWPHAVTAPIHRERILVALPCGHHLAARESLGWSALRDQVFLVQGWDECQSARELYASFFGSGAKFQTHAASKQSIFALVAAGFGVTLATESQTEAVFPGVVFKTIAEPDAWVQTELAWLPDTEDAAVGRFVAFMRDQAQSRQLF